MTCQGHRLTYRHAHWYPAVKYGGYKFVFAVYQPSSLKLTQSHLHDPNSEDIGAIARQVNDVTSRGHERSRPRFLGTE